MALRYTTTALRYIRSIKGDSFYTLRYATTAKSIVTTALRDATKALRDPFSLIPCYNSAKADPFAILRYPTSTKSNATTYSSDDFEPFDESSYQKTHSISYMIRAEKGRI